MAAVDDIRIKIGFFDHPKTEKLKRRIGYEGIVSLMRLWSFAAANRPKGILSSMTDEDIEIAAKWSGDEGAFVKACVELRFIDEQDGVFYLHDWEENQGWAYYAEERSNAARNAANAKWGNKNNSGNAENKKEHSAPQSEPQTTRNADKHNSECAPHAPCIKNECAPHAEGNAENENPQCPFPYPLPNPLPNPKPKEKKTLDDFGEKTPQSPTEIFANEIPVAHELQAEPPDKDAKKDAKTEELFEQLWAIYPRKEGKTAVSKKAKAELLSAGYEAVSACIAEYRRRLRENCTESKFIMHGGTFFNGRWRDYIAAAPPKGHAEYAYPVPAEFSLEQYCTSNGVYDHKKAIRVGRALRGDENYADDLPEFIQRTG